VSLRLLTRGVRGAKVEESVHRSPVRGTGSPHRPRHGREVKVSNKLGWAGRGDPRMLSARSTLVGSMDAGQVAKSGRIEQVPLRGPEASGKAKLQRLDEDDAEMIKFYGQLWSIPMPSAPRVSHIRVNFFWIRRDLWEFRSFSWKDCYSVKAEDILREDLKEGNFTVHFWGQRCVLFLPRSPDRGDG
jgi:hypothetical protein